MKHGRTAAIALLLAMGAFPQPVAESDASGEPHAANANPLQAKESLQYGIEWRLIRAGLARIDWSPPAASQPGYRGGLHLESGGLVSKLYRVNDNYSVELSNELCAQNIALKSEEGKRRRDTKVAFDHAQGKLHYLERDLVKNTTVLAKDLDVPPCVQDVVAGLYKMRTLGLQPGQHASIPVTDGKKFANVKVEAQERENVKTPTGNYKTIRHEAFIFNNIIYSKNGRCLVWLTDDAQRTPVRIEVRMRFLIGTVTLTLEKHERI